MFFESVYFYFLKVTDVNRRSDDGANPGQPGASSGQPIAQVSTPSGNVSSIVFVNVNKSRTVVRRGKQSFHVSMDPGVIL